MARTLPSQSIKRFRSRPKTSAILPSVVKNICLCAVVLAGAVWFLSQLMNASFTSSLEFEGALRPGEELVSIMLPPEAILDSIVVSEGQDVRASQTLATYDRPAIELKLEALRNQLQHNGYMTSCLLNEFASTTPELENETLKTAHLACQRILLAAQQYEAMYQQGELQTDKEEKHLKALMQLGVEGDQSAGSISTKQLIEYSFAWKRLQDGRLRNQAEHDRQVSLYEQKKLQVLSQLETEAIAIQRQSYILRSFMDSPRLLSPVAGVVEKIRVPMGGEQSDEMEIVGILKDDTRRFEVTVDVPAWAARSWPPDQKVLLQVKSMLPSFPTLEGKVVSVAWSGSQAALVTVELTKASEAKLNDPNLGFALHGAGTKAVIKAQKNQSQVKKAVTMAVSDLLSWTPNVVNSSFQNRALQ